MAKPLTFRVPDVIDEEIERQADERGVTRSDICREALFDGLGQTAKLKGDYSTNDKIHAVAREIRSIRSHVRGVSYELDNHTHGGIDANNSEIIVTQRFLKYNYIILLGLIAWVLWGL